MNCLLSILKQSNVLVSWHTIFVGLQHHLISNQDVIDFAIDALVECPSKEDVYIIPLASANASDRDIPKLLHNIAIHEAAVLNQALDERKWRYAVLQNLYDKYKGKNSLQENQNLMEEIDLIYCDFDHSKDMVHLVSYMPAVGPSTGPEGIRRDFEQFVQSERETLVREGQRDK